MTSRMKEIREKRGLGQKEVAAMVGIPVRTYGGYERGERTLSLDVAAQIADVLDVSLDTLLGREIRNFVAHFPAQGSGAKTFVLSPEERELIVNYRKCHEGTRSTIRSLAASLSLLPEESEYYYQMAIAEQEQEQYDEIMGGGEQ